MMTEMKETVVSFRNQSALFRKVLTLRLFPNVALFKPSSFAIATIAEISSMHIHTKTDSSW